MCPREADSRPYPEPHADRNAIRLHIGYPPISALVQSRIKEAIAPVSAAPLFMRLDGMMLRWG